MLGVALRTAAAFAGARPGISPIANRQTDSPAAPGLVRERSGPGVRLPLSAWLAPTLPSTARRMGSRGGDSRPRTASVGNGASSHDPKRDETRTAASSVDGSRCCRSAFRWEPSSLPRRHTCRREACPRLGTSRPRDDEAKGRPCMCKSDGCSCCGLVDREWDVGDAAIDCYGRNSRKRLRNRKLMCARARYWVRAHTQGSVSAPCGGYGGSVRAHTRNRWDEPDHAGPPSLGSISGWG